MQRGLLSQLGTVRTVYVNTIINERLNCRGISPNASDVKRRLSNTVSMVDVDTGSEEGLNSANVVAVGRAKELLPHSFHELDALDGGDAIRILRNAKAFAKVVFKGGLVEIFANEDETTRPVFRAPPLSLEFTVEYHVDALVHELFSAPSNSQDSLHAKDVIP